MPTKSSKKLVNEATTDDLNPPAGYVLQQLATKTVGSVEECQVIEDLVLKKLEKNRPYIKHKALRIIKYICDNGHPSWRIAWQRHSDKIRACAHFRGPPDPIHGDAPYERVRAAAKVAMDAVFSTTTRDRSAIGSRIVGKGGDSTPSAPTSKPPTATFKSGSRGVYSSPSTGSGGSKMTGYGNTDYIPKARPEKFKQHKDSNTYNSQTLGASRHSTKAIDNRHNRQGKRNKGQVGGVWGNDDDNDDDEEADWDENFQDEPEYPTRRGFTASTTRPKVGGRVNTVKSDGTFEQNWVDGVASGGGVGGRIVDADLKRYVQQFENLSQSHALEALEDKLTDGTWQQQTKSLTLISALLEGTSSDLVADYFDNHSDCIEDLMEASRSAVRKKATSIAKTIGILDEPVQRPPPRQAIPVQSQPPPQQAQPAPVAQEEEPEDLLGFGTPAATTAAPTVAAAPASAAPTSLFGNLTIQSNGAPPQPQPQPQAAPAVQSAPVVPQPSVVQPASNGPTVHNDMDWMSSLASASPAKPSGPDSFDPMSFSQPKPQPQPPVMTQPSAAAAGPSAFAFVQPTAQPQPQPQPQTATSFAFMSNPSGHSAMGQPTAMGGMGMGMSPQMGMGMGQPMQSFPGGMGGAYQVPGMGSMGGMNSMGMGMNTGMGYPGMGQGMMGHGMPIGVGAPTMQQPMNTGAAAVPRYQNGGDPFSTLLDPSSKGPPPKQHQQQQELFSEFSLK